MTDFVLISRATTTSWIISKAQKIDWITISASTTRTRPPYVSLNARNCRHSSKKAPRRKTSLPAIALRIAQSLTSFNNTTSSRAKISIFVIQSSGGLGVVLSSPTFSVSRGIFSQFLVRDCLIPLELVRLTSTSTQVLPLPLSASSPVAATPFLFAEPA